ncbi:expressed unknown protein [Seminavis robusta]|uniref:Uncharacterized protein n=1 Tax=Seminavis robusta TaxID=568900 RepID=A0A9N8E483_9STRA|nr:expressed unknown protein [Seminavis robusta]|eukprot:Sro647_g180990.1 n/a (523) ;mRNA; r:48795-50363
MSETPDSVTHMTSNSGGKIQDPDRHDTTDTKQLSHNLLHGGRGHHKVIRSKQSLRKMNSPEETNNNGEYILSRFKAILQECLAASADCENCKEESLDEWAKLIYQSMTTKARVYHDVEHVLEVLQYYQQECSVHQETPDPISKLAILFHDVIYISLDKQLSPPQTALLQDIVRQDTTTRNDNVPLITLLPPPTPRIAMVYAIFDIAAPSQRSITAPGTNELLSALVAVQTLQSVLTPPQLLQMVVAIEATIPFRPPAAIDALFQRTRQQSSAEGSTNPDAAARTALHQAMRVAYSDLGVFANEDITAFIDSNWRLLPEWFPILQSQNSATVADLSAALASVRQRPMDTTVIFPSFDEQTVEGKQRQATVNLQVLRDYMSVRELTIHMILDLLAEQLNNKNQDNHASGSQETIPIGKWNDMMARIVPALPNYADDDATKSPDDNDVHAQLLLRVLGNGRRVAYPWDAKASPLGAALFQELDLSSFKVSQLLEERRSKKDNNCTAGWLDLLPGKLMEITRSAIV